MNSKKILVIVSRWKSNKLFHVFSYFSILAISLIQMGESQVLRFPSAFLSCNDNKVVNIESEINSYSWKMFDGKFIDSKIDNNFKIEINLPKMSINVPLKYDLVVSISGVDFNDEKLITAVQSYVRLRLNGASVSFVKSLISSKRGLIYKECIIDYSLLNNWISAPAWLISDWNLSDGVDVRYLDDGDVRRFFFIVEDNVIGESAIDIRDAGSDRLRANDLADAFKGIRNVKDEKIASRFQRIAEWMYLNKKIKWLSPYEIPRLGEY